MTPDRIGPERIGFDRLLRLRWLDRAALLAAELRDAEALHQAMLTQLAGELPGEDARRKTANVLTRIWWRVPDEHVSLRDGALAQIKGCTPEERLVYHWGMCLLAYPIFRDVAATVGRLLRLQGTFRQGQVLNRISAEWGNRLTLNTAVPRIVLSMADWGVLELAGEKGVYRATSRMTVTRMEPMAWLLSAVRQLHEIDGPNADLLQIPELFLCAIPPSRPAG